MGEAGTNSIGSETGIWLTSGFMGNSLWQVYYLSYW